MSRRVEITSPYGSQVQFRQMTGTEALSSLHAWEVDLLSDSKNLDFKQGLGQHATLTLETEGLGKRYLDGIITRFAMEGQDTGAKISYRMILSPWLWLATRKTDFKIWQNMTVPQIIESVLGPFGKPMEFKLNRAYRSRDFTVQYHETCYNFVARLCESEGIYWRYVHQAGSHTVVFCDDVVGSHEPLPGGDTIPFYPPGKSALAPREHIYAWLSGQEIRPGKAYLDDYHFKTPRADLSNSRKNPPGHEHDQWESYIWPGGFTNHGDGDVYTRVQMETDLARQKRAQAQLTKRAIAPGYTIQLDNYPREDQNQQYLVVAVQYHLQENVNASQGVGGAADGGSIQQFSMEVHPTSVPYRPDIVTPKPRTHGPQTAIVVGPANEEIWTDQYGRVKVQFYWDRIGAMDENSSCWVRVSTSWAGPQFGATFIPRIGMEVIIDFLSGDPDYPILLGCVTNADNMPPWSLPGNATQSGIKTKSSKGGAFGAGMKNGPGDANALRFEDKAGAEQVWLHAQKDQLIEVEHDEDHWVGNDRRKNVDHDETTVIGNDRTETVMHDETITVHNNRTERVDVNEKISIGVNRDEDVGVNEVVSIGVNQTFNVGVNRTKSVGVNETDSIGTKWGINVGKIKTESIGLFSMQNIGIANMQNIGVARMTTIGVAYNLNVGMIMATTVGMNQSTNVGVNQDTTVGALQTITVGTNQTTTVGANQTLTAGANISTTAGAIATHSTGGAMNLLAGGMLLCDGQSVQVIGTSNITLTCGGSSIVMSPGSITIVSGTVLINP